MSDGKSKRDDFVLLIFISLNKQNLIKFLKSQKEKVSEEHVLILLPHLVLIIKPCQTNTQCYRSKLRSVSKRGIEGKDHYLIELLIWKVSAGY